MNVINNIKQIIKPKPKFLSESRFHIKEAFVIGNKTFYEMESIFNLPYQRAMSALTFYDEVRTKMSPEFLHHHSDAMDAVLSNPKQIDIQKVCQLQYYFKERLQMLPTIDMIFKLASVVFFDETENPVLYDFAYGQKKIKFWKEHEEVLAFFLREPCVRLIPFLKQSAHDIVSYSQLNEQRMDYQMKVLQSQKFKKQ